MIKIPQTLKSLTLCTTLAIAASINGTHPARAAGVPLDGNNTGTVTYGGTFSNYAVPQRWTFETGPTNITTPTIKLEKDKMRYDFPAQNPQVLVTGTLLPNLYRHIDPVQRDIVPSYTIEALNSRGERVTASIENEHQIIKLPITAYNQSSSTGDGTAIGELTLAVAESRIIAMDFLRYENKGKSVSGLVPTTVAIYDDMRGTAGPSAVGCAFPSTGGGPAGFNPNVSSPFKRTDIDSGAFSNNGGSAGYPSDFVTDNIVKTASETALQTMSKVVNFSRNDAIVYSTKFPNGINHAYLGSLWDYGGDPLRVTSLAVRSSCDTPSMASTYLDKIGPSKLLPDVDKSIVKLILGSSITSAVDKLTNAPSNGVSGIESIETEIHVRGAMSVVAAPESVTFAPNQKQVDWSAHLTIVVAAL